MTEFVQADPNKVLIIDVSKWQDDPDTLKIPDFQRMYDLGASGIIIKCGEGTFLDREFLAYVDSLKSVGIPYGFYWYYNNKYSPKDQVDTFIEAIHKVGYPPLGVWLDLEDRKSGAYAGWRKWYDFLFDLEREFPDRLIGIYTNHWYFIEYTTGLGIPTASLNWFKHFPLWVASYGNYPSPTPPWVNDLTLWQFTDFLDGLYYGAESKELDGSYFNGNFSEFRNFFGLDDDTIPSEPPKEIKKVKTIYIYSDGSQKEI